MAYIFGGDYGSNGLSDDVWKWDPSAGTAGEISYVLDWDEASPDPNDCADGQYGTGGTPPSSCDNDDANGGVDDRRATSAVWDPIQGSESSGDVAYIFGGVTMPDDVDPQPANTAEILKFDPAGPSVNPAGASLGSALLGTAAVWDEANDVAYIFGGEDPATESVDTIQEFDPSGPTVTDLATLPEDVSFASAVWDDENGVAYIFGGENSTADPVTKHSAIYRFDPDGNPKVKKVGTLSKARSHTSAFWNGTAAFVLGGDTASGATKRTDRFVPGEGTTRWHDLELPGGSHAVHSASAVPSAAESEGYLFGGDTGSLTGKVLSYETPGIPHDGDIVADPDPAVTEDPEQAAMEISGSGPYDVTLRTKIDHAPCDPGHLGCRFDGNVQAAVVLVNRSMLETEGFGTKLSQLTVGEIDSGILPGRDPRPGGDNPGRVQTFNVDYDGAPPSTEEFTVSGVSLGDFRAGDIVTMIGVVDWCADRYLNETVSDGYKDTEACAIDEHEDSGTLANEQNIFFHQWIVPPLDLDATFELKNPASMDALNATDFGSDTKVNLTLENQLDSNLDLVDGPGTKEFDVEVDITGGGSCPISPSCDFELNGTKPENENGSSINTTLSWPPDEAGVRTLTVNVTWLAHFADVDLPYNHPESGRDADEPVRFTDQKNYPYKAVDFAVDQVAGTDAATPGTTNITLQSTVTNVGDLEATRATEDEQVVVEWKRCNRLEQSDYECPVGPDESSDPWIALNGSGEDPARQSFPPETFSPGSSAEATMDWEAGNQSGFGLWSVRSWVDPPGVNNYLDPFEHGQDNNLAASTVRMTNVTWTADNDTVRDEFEGAETVLNHTLGFTNLGQAEDTRSFEILRRDVECQSDDDADSDCADWEFNLYDENGERIDLDKNANPHADIDWGFSASETTFDPLDVDDLDSLATQDVTLEVFLDENDDGTPDRLEPGDFADVTLAVCEDAEPGNDPTGGFDDADGTCPGDGNLLRVRSSFNPPFGARFDTIGKDSVTVEAGKTATFHFRVTNVADNAWDVFHMTQGISPNLVATVPSFERTKPAFQVCGDTLTVDPDKTSQDIQNELPSGTSCSLAEAREDPAVRETIDMAPGESNRFRMEVEVNGNVSDGKAITVRVDAESLNASAGDEIVSSHTFTVTVGQDVSPPTIVASPSAPAVLRADEEIDFDITDGGDITSVQRSINGAAFSNFEAPYNLSTEGRPDGPLEVRIRAADDTGNQITEPFNYTIDDTPPRVDAVVLSPETVAAGGSFDVSVGLSEPHPASVQVRVAGNATTLSFDANTGLWTASGVQAPGSDGLHVVEIEATDQAIPDANEVTVEREIEVVTPDVRIDGDDVRTEPRAPREGQTVRVTARVTNPSNVELSPYPVALVVDGSEHARKNVTLLPNKETETTFEWSGSTGGHTLVVVGDPDADFVDADRDNQRAEFSVRIRSKGLLPIPGPEIVIIAAALVLGALGRRRWDARDPDERDP